MTIVDLVKVGLSFYLTSRERSRQKISQKGGGHPWGLDDLYLEIEILRVWQDIKLFGKLLFLCLDKIL